MEVRRGVFRLGRKAEQIEGALGSWCFPAPPPRWGGKDCQKNNPKRGPWAGTHYGQQGGSCRAEKSCCTCSSSVLGWSGLLFADLQSRPVGRPWSSRCETATAR